MSLDGPYLRDEQQEHLEVCRVADEQDRPGRNRMVGQADRTGSCIKEAPRIIRASRSSLQELKGQATVLVGDARKNDR